MSHIIENGSGVVGGEAYIEPTFVTAYLLSRDRAGENGWTTPEAAEEDAATIAASDHVENRFREQFKGQKEFRDISLARATLTLNATNPGAGETVVIGSTGGNGAGTYTFVAALAVAGDVLVGTTAAASLANLIAAVNLDVGQSGVGYDAATTENEDATASLFIDDSMVAFAKATGTAGNAVATTETLAIGGWNFGTLKGGSNIVTPQPLSFPRIHLFDRDGIPVIGIPLRLKYAVAEYAVRARLPAVLAPDPTIDPLGGIITRLKEKVGPIEVDTSYSEGTAPSGKLPDYPAADRLLRDYIFPAGKVVRN